MEINLSIVMIQQYENKELLNQCIESVRKQKCKTAKALLVGGKDYTKAELLNKGIELGGTTDFILFINTYEELKEGFIDKCFNVFSKYPVGAVYTDFEKGYLNGVREYLPSFNRAKITQGWPIPTTAMFRREIFNVCGTFDASLTIFENWDMWLRASEAFPLYHIPENLYISKHKLEEKVSTNALEEAKKYILEKAEQRTNAKQRI